MEFKSGIRQRGNSFQFIVSVAFDGNGKQVRKYDSFKPSENLTDLQLKKAVEAAYDEFVARARNNQSLKEIMRFSELADLYFSQYATNSLKEITAYTYEGSYRKNIKPVFGSTRLKDISTTSITEFLLKLGETKKSSTVRKNKIIMHSMLKYAVSQKIIPEKPCVGTVWKGDVEAEMSEITNVLTTEEAKTLLQLTEKYSSFHTAIRLLLLTGLRSGEALGLTWDKVDLKNKTIFIDKTLTYIKGKYFLSKPKTKASIRKSALMTKRWNCFVCIKLSRTSSRRLWGSHGNNPIVSLRLPQVIFTTAVC